MTEKETNGDLTQSFVSITAGARFSHYEVISRIGSGGMGDIFLARDNVLDRRVVLKFLPSHLERDKTFKERFLREARTAASLNHPNVITIYEIEEFKGRPYIAMEFIDGETLGDRIRHDPPDTITSLDIVAQICNGLQKAHSAGIVHRDIKPDNVMLARDGFVKVLDFGLAKFQSESRLTQAGTTLGTANYMSPEQGQGQDTDHRSDIFSTGIVLYELLTGTKAFHRQNIPATIHAIVHDDLPLLGTHNDTLDEAYQKIIDKSLSKIPDNRYQSISEMIADINVLRGQSQILPTIASSLGVPKFQAKSLAVLCLNNIGLPEDEFLSYGITEDLIVDLARIGTLRLAPMRKVMKYRDSDAELSEIAEQLNVNYILDGSFYKSGSAIRLSVQLIEISTDQHLWADRWECTDHDLPQIKQSLARGVGEALEVDATVIRNSAIASQQIGNAEAYEFYLRGKYTFDHLKDRSDLEVALGLYNQALSLEPNLLAVHAGIAEVYDHRGDHERAAVELTTALKASRKKGLKADQFRVLLLLAVSRIHLSQWDEGQSLANEALKIAKVRGDLSGEADSLRVLIDINERRAEFDQAILRFERVMEINRQLDDQDQVAEALKSIGNVHFRKGEYRRARTLYEEAIGIARRRGNVLLDAKCICNIGLTHSHTGELDEAISCYEKALQMYRQVGERTGEANAYNNMALIHSSRGAFNKALQFGIQASAIQKELGDRGEFALASCNVARYQAILGQYDVAIATANEALAIANELKYPFVINLANDSLGYCCYCSGDLVCAKQYFTTALITAKESDLRREMALALSNLGEINYYLDDLSACREYTNEAIQLAAELMGEKVSYIRALSYLGVLTVQDGDVTSGIGKLRDAIDDAQELGDPRFIITAQRLLASILISGKSTKVQQAEGRELLSRALTLAEEKQIAHEIRLCKAVYE